MGNSSKRDKVVKYFKSLSMYVFIPFFTQVGLMLNVPVLIASFGFSFLSSVVRALCMFLGTSLGGTMAGIPRDRAVRLWAGIMPQVSSI